MFNRLKPKIGFVILVWNSQKVIRKCLQSIAKLDIIIPYVVVVDNGSTDKTHDIVKEYEEKYPDIFSSITYTENKGTTISRNAGLKSIIQYKPDYFCILDSDTEINDIAFQRLVFEMESHSQYGLIGPTMVTSSGFVQMSARCFPTVLEKFYKAVPIKRLQKKGELMEIQKPPYDDAESYPVDYLMSACWLFRPEVLEKVGFLDENIFYAPEDAEYCIRLWKAGYQVAFCPSAKIIHEWQRLSKKKLFSKMNWEHLKGLAYMFLKHRYLFDGNEFREVINQKKE